jgi:predicted alpha/beta-fold hydrolase
LIAGQANNPPITPPWWLKGGDLQTIWAARLAAFPSPTGIAQRQRWDTPDGDFIDVDWWPAGAAGAPGGPVNTGTNQRALCVLFHGLEGDSGSHYAQAFGSLAQAHGWDYAVPHFRGCSGELNRGPRAYHSGDHVEIDWVLRRLKALDPGRPMVAVGVSLGGNALLRWAAEQGHSASGTVAALAALSAPLDLTAAGNAIDQGFNRWVYARMFLSSMRPKAEAKWRQYPGLFDLEAVRRARTLRAFDDAFTAPLHGFAGVDDYWHRAAAKPVLANIRVPALVLNALNDPFVPGSSLPGVNAVGPYVRLWQPAHGGHVGFLQRSGTGLGVDTQAVPRRVMDWLSEMGGLPRG